MPSPCDTHSFDSFWTGGFEGADHVNAQGIALDMNALTGHASQLRGDYRRARAAGMRTVRESVGWRIAAHGTRFDFSRARQMAGEAQKAGLSIAWTLWHYGLPAHVDPFAGSLPGQMAEFADAFARDMAALIPADVWINPVNEISFLTWLLTESGAVQGFPEGMKARAPELKRNLVTAAIAATAAIRRRIPAARFFHTDPVIHVVAPDGRRDLEAAARAECDSQFEAWDLLMSPQVRPDVPVKDRFHLVGVNYYHSSQWEHGSRDRLHWHLRDARRVRLTALLERVARRYPLPVALTETSHVGSGRASWLRELADDLGLHSKQQSPCSSICIYPLIDRPDWDDPQHWHRSGLWDVAPRVHAQGGRRLLHRPYWQVLAPLVHAQSSRAPPNPQPKSTITPPATHNEPGNLNVINTLIVFSHLRWDFVYQRPQHIVSRLARRWRVLFVEEPVRHEGAPTVERIDAAANVTVLRFHTSLASPGFHDDQLAMLRPMLADVLKQMNVTDYGVWFYTPMALPLLQVLKPRIICYDCMDELRAFLNPPRQLLQRETALLRIANVVFTGGPSLYRAKQPSNANVYCIPSSVDAAHFGRGRRPDEAIPEFTATPGPRLGFYGVIDERFDVDLLATCAELRPDWHFQIVGPIVKLDPAMLPRRPNIHYFGQQPYENLPGVLAAWDVALLPFARNESTRFISPTKTLEYLAAELPIVSTPIADVVELYGSAVAFADNARDFIRACETLLAETDELREARVAAARSLVQQTSWDAAAAKMQQEIDTALPRGLLPDVALLFGDAGHEPAAPAKQRVTQRVPCLIAGAGPTGLSAAYHFGAGATLLEAAPTAGGWCKSITEAGFTFDHAGHIMFSDSPVVLDLYRKLLGDNVWWQDREAWVYSHDTYTRYPFQGALYGLPPPVIKECLLGAIEARFGTVDQAANSPAIHKDCCADGTDIGAGTAMRGAPSGAPRNFEEFIHRVWGSGIAAHFAVPYNRKLWGVPLDEMETSWLGGRVPLPDLAQMIDGALSPVPRPMGPNARFGYPLRGGFQALTDGFLPLLEGPLHLNARVRSVSPARHEVELADGRQFRYDSLISTIPLPDLIKAVGLEAPASVRQAAAKLRRVSVRCVNLGIGRPKLTEKHWIYYPGETIFHRVFVQGNASPHCNPPGGFGLTCEITYSPTKPLRHTGKELIARCIADCIRVGLFEDSDPVWAANEVDMPYAYVLYDHARAESVATIRSWLAMHDILLAGRYSEWEYYNSDHAFLAGKRAAESVTAADLQLQRAAKSA